MKNVIESLEKMGELCRIDEPVDLYLEMAHIAYAEVKKPGGGQALLFTKPVDRKNGKEFDVPVLMNLYGSTKRTEWIFGKPVESIAAEIEGLMKMSPPQGFMDKLGMLGKLFDLKSVFPKRLSGKGACQQVVQTGDEVKLSDLPVLTTWPEDGGPFITMGQIYTRSLDGKLNNLGMYRLQVYDDKTVGLHWQIHKDSSHFFDQYKRAGKPMPVAVAIGGDPLYTWCGQAPLPHGVFELLMYGFIRKKPARLVKCLTNDLWVPEDADYVIEGTVEDPSRLKIEGPFGDHTGYYTLREPYPFMKVTAVTRKKEPVYLATVVGKPPIEDKYMGWGTERIFLPLLKTTAPDLIDYKMPENGVFHNLILAKIKTLYPGHAQQAMHAFWGVGQMSFVKHAVFVGEDAPDLNDYNALFRYILERLDFEKVLISHGVVDALDHSSPKPCVGGKLGVDCTGEPVSTGVEVIGDEGLYAKLHTLAPEIVAVKQYGTDTPNPVAVIQYQKKEPVKRLIQLLEPLGKHFRVVVFVDEKRNEVENPYMLVWRVVNNMDAVRDVTVGDFIAVDGTCKSELDGYLREWPGDTDCDPATVKALKEKGLWPVDEKTERFYQL